MNRQIIFFLVFTFSCFVELQAQEVLADRQTPEADLHNRRKGELVDFQKLMRRLETAFKEQDISSANELRSDVVAAMKERISEMEAEKSDDQKHLNELKEQRDILKATEVFQFSSKNGDNEAAMNMLEQLHRFEQLMEKNFEMQ